jgi:ubiquinol-cytochrome c reductase cytochrome b subunit
VQSLSPTAQSGAQLFESRGCINCHQIAGAGGQRGPDLTHVGSRLRDYDLTWRILNGGRNMPAYGSTLSPEETSALVELLLSLR